MTVLTTEYGNLPYWSPDGERIVFTRRHSGFNFDVFTIRSDGSDLKELTTSPANDAHAVWTDDCRHIMWSSGVSGWKEEAALDDRNFQPYGQIFIMNADGSKKRQLTDRAHHAPLGLWQKGANRSQRARRDRLAPDGSEARPSTQRRLEPVAAGARQDVGRVGQCSP